MQRGLEIWKAERLYLPWIHAVHELRARQQQRRGGSIALLIREGSSARVYLMRCRCERRLTQIEWGMGGNNATDCEECPQIYAVWVWGTEGFTLQTLKNSHAYMYRGCEEQKGVCYKHWRLRTDIGCVGCEEGKGLRLYVPDCAQHKKYGECEEVWFNAGRRFVMGAHFLPFLSANVVFYGSKCCSPFVATCIYECVYTTFSVCCKVVNVKCSGRFCSARLHI